jgi:hypothetical protein
LKIDELGTWKFNLQLNCDDFFVWEASIGDHVIRYTKAMEAGASFVGGWC